MRSRRRKRNSRSRTRAATIGLQLLFLTPQLPYPPQQGTAIRNWGLIKHLAQRHAITLLSFTADGQSADAPALRAVCHHVVTVPAPRRSPADRLRTLFSRQPDLAKRLWSPEYAQALLELLRETPFHAVHLEGLEMAPYLPALQQHPHLRSLYDAHNVEHILQRRACRVDLRQPARWPAALYSWLQIRRLERLEAEVCRSASAVTCVSGQDAAALQQLAPSLRPVVVPNGIEFDDYAGFRLRTAPNPTRLVFTGKMDYRPNIDGALWFIDDILPRIRARRPEAEFVVVGQRPPESLRRLNGRKGVVVAGAVEDVRPYIAEAAVYVAPLRMGGGTRFKLLEAMALARPVVSTTLGAEGFDLQSGREMLLAESPEAFADAVLALFAEPGRAEAMGRAGQAFVRAGHDWSVIVPKLEAVLSQELSREASP